MHQDAGLRILLNPKQPLRNRGYKLLETKGKELLQSFHLVIECFILAEEKKRVKCQTSEEPCNHWWHQDLSNSEVISQIIKRGIF